MPRRDDDPYAAFSFLVEIDGLTQAGFSECSGLESETEVEDYKEGGLNTHLHKLIGQSKYRNIVLKRGITASTELWDWHQKVAQGEFSLASKVRKNLSIVLLDEKKTEKVRWNIRNAWPCKWTGPDLKADTSSVAIQTLEITHEGIELA